MIRPILHLPAPLLRAVSEPAEFGSALKELAADMIETMYAAPGVGLAAVQIGVLKRVIVVDRAGESLVLVNPKIVGRSDNKAPHQEGCLSIPNFWRVMQRYLRVNVDYFDLDGRKNFLVATREFAACVQHELDHLDGKLIIDGVLHTS